MTMRFRQHSGTGSAPRRLAARVCVAGMVVLAAGTQAAPDEADDETGQQSAVSEAADGAAGDSETAPADVFQPTEEISEDYAAPFPVDI